MLNKHSSWSIFEPPEHPYDVIVMAQNVITVPANRLKRSMPILSLVWVCRASGDYSWLIHSANEAGILGRINRISARIQNQTAQNELKLAFSGV